MATFPNGVVALNNPTGADTLSTAGVVHSTQHANANDEIEAIEGFLLPALNTQTVDYTLVLGDASKTVEINSGTARVLTVPPNSSVAFAVGSVVGIRQYGAGTMTVAAGAGVTIRSRGGVVAMAGQYAEAMLTKRGTNEWVLSGDVA